MVFKLLTLRLVIQEIIRNNGTWLRNINEIESHPMAAIGLYIVVIIIKLDVLCLNSGSYLKKKKKQTDGWRVCILLPDFFYLRL